MSDYLYKDMPKLGFGLMRLPTIPGGTQKDIDFDKVQEMVDLFMSRGFHYFDTAFVYPGSEAAAKAALVDRHPRDSYTLATKMNAAIPGLTEKMVKNEFETSLKRTGAGYFDYYLLHALQKINVKKYEKFDTWGFVKEKKAQGQILHVGEHFDAHPAQGPVGDLDHHALQGEVGDGAGDVEGGHDAQRADEAAEVRILLSDERDDEVV